MSGYGPRLVVEFDREMPDIVNRGWNCFETVGMDIIELDRVPDLAHTSNDAVALCDSGRFCGWIIARFTNGETPLFIDHHSSAYDASLKHYTSPVFSIQG